MRRNLRSAAVFTLALAFAAVSVPTVVHADDEVNGEWSKFDCVTNYGPNEINRPTAPTTNSDNWRGDYVYYGKYNGSPVKYRVLDPNCEDFYNAEDKGSPLYTLFLDCDTVLKTGKWGSTNTNWGSNDCDLRLWMNGTFLNDNGNFTAVEKTAIPVVWKQYPESESIVQTNYYLIGLTHNEKVFPLDMKDIYNPNYGYSSEKSKTHIKSSTLWWLRTRVNNNNKDTHAATSNAEGGHSAKPVTETYGYSPAFNVLKENIVFNTKIESGTNETYGNSYKLTLKDENTELTVTSVARSGNTVTVEYTVDDKTPNDDISADTATVYIIRGSETIMYTKLVGDFSDGTGSFTLPDGYNADTDYIYILAEDVNGQYETDYASEMQLIKEYNVTLPECMEITNGATLTDGKAFNTTEIKFRVRDGYTASNVKLNSEDLSADEDGIYTIVVDGGMIVTADSSYEDSIGAELKGYSLSLEGDIGVNFYMSLDDSVLKDNDAYMLFTLPDNKKEKVYVKDVKEAPKTVEGFTGVFYVFKCNVPAKDMDKTITAQMKTSKGDGTSYPYSVNKYAQYIIDYTGTDTTLLNAKGLAEAMRDYGAATKYAFEKTGTSVTSKISGADVLTKLGETYKLKTPASSDGKISYYGSSLILDSKTSERHYFLNTSEKAITKVTIGNTEFTGDSIKQWNNTKYYYVQGDPISAEVLGDIHVIEAYTDGTAPVITFSYSPMHYVYTLLSTYEADDPWYTQAITLYTYWDEANKYAHPTTT